MTTATARANPNLAFSKYWGIETEYVALVTRFCMISRNPKPVIILPTSYFALQETIGWQAIVGTLIAIVGVAIVFLA